MQSNKTYHRIFKYGLLGAGVLMLAISIVSWFLPQLIVMNGESMEKDIFITIIFGLIGIFLIIIFFSIKNKFVLVSMENQLKVIKTDVWEKSVNWMDVESLSLIQICISSPV
ncbi:MAG: hypothetical protein WD426_08590 [Anditalea sp.]